MTQFTKLSVEAQTTVNNFCNKMWSKNFTNNPLIILGASLYAISLNSKSSVTKVLGNYVIDLKDVLSLNQIEILNGEYTNVILACFDQSSEDLFRIGATRITPSALVDLCIKIADCNPNSEIYLPHNGIGEFSRKLKGYNCEGYEQNRINWAISEILNSVMEVECDIKCAAFEEVMNDKEYDYVFTCPPFDRNYETTSSLISLFKTNLKKGGELYTIVPFHVCTTASGRQGFDFRKTAADLNVSMAVIVLPRETFQPYSGIKTCLIRIKKDGLGQVALADFSSPNFAAEEKVGGRKRYTLKVESIIKALYKCDERLVWSGTYSELTGNLSLSPNRYLPIDNTPTLSAGEKFVRLGDLIENISVVRLSVRMVKPIIGNKELSDDYLNCVLSASNLASNAIETSTILDKECLLVGFIGGKVKVAKLKDVTGVNSVSLRHDIFPFRVSSNIITEDYLLRSLLSDFSKEQIVRLSTGSTISRISFRDLCDILIKVPSLEEQKKTCYDDAHAGIKEADVKLQKAYKDFRMDIHMKKHAIGQTLANFKNWWKLLDQVRSSGNGIINEDAVIGRIHKVSVKEIFENLNTSISKLSMQLNKFDTGYGLVKDEIALTEFIEKYIQENKSPLFKYEYNPTDHRSMGDIPEVVFEDDSLNCKLTGNYILRKGDPLEHIKFPQEALATIFNNIVSNACVYGFSNREDAENIIKIEIDSIGSDYIVSISNNGKQLDSKMSCNDITVYGQTSGDTNTHFGIGGYEIKRLMEEFGDNVEIVSKPKDEFTVTYKLIFHDTNIILSL